MSERERKRKSEKRERDRLSKRSDNSKSQTGFYSLAKTKRDKRMMMI